MDFLKDLSIDKVRNLAEDAYNQAKPKTEVETRVYEVLSHKNWGASSSLLNEIARDTYDYEKFAVISQIMWESMENQRPAAWRVVFKGLTLLEHLVKNGSERCVDDARNHGHTLRSLQNFNYYEGTVDRGSGVREKTKQIMEILSDDERIREERQKARELREKFGQKIGGVSSSGNRSGGGGSYSGYGQDSWDSKGASGGYGDGGIGSGGGSKSRSSGYSGRYDEDDTRPARVTESAPTFAAIPEKTTKKKKKKKEKAAPAPAPESEVDLFSFDAPAPAPAAATTEPASDEFDAFQSAGASAAPMNDPFAAPAAAPVQQQNAQFNAFGGAPQQAAPMQQQPSAQFDAFGGQAMGGAMGGTMNGTNAFGAMGGQTMNGSGMMQQQQMPMGGMQGMQPSSMGGQMGGNAMMQQPQQAQQQDDEFGDFTGSAPSQSKSSGPISSDPMSKLISLDGLSKNTEKEDKLNAPIIANDAAAQFVQEKEQIQASVQQGTKGSSMSFAGIDGLHKTPNMMGQQMNMMAPAASMGTNPSVMGSGMGGGNAIGMMDPRMMSSSQPQQQQQPQGGNMGMAGGMMGQGMMGGQQGSGMMGGNMGMQGENMGMQGGMNMNQQQQQQQQMMMNNQMGGMQGMGMPGNVSQGGNVKQMGGQQMGGWQ